MIHLAALMLIIAIVLGVWAGAIANAVMAGDVVAAFAIIALPFVAWTLTLVVGAVWDVVRRRKGA